MTTHKLLITVGAAAFAVTTILGGTGAVVAAVPADTTMAAALQDEFHGVQFAPDFDATEGAEAHASTGTNMNYNWR